jgi:hypothetical protein
MFQPLPPGITGPAGAATSGRMPMVGVDNRCWATPTDAGTASNAGDFEPEGASYTGDFGAGGAGGASGDGFSVRGSGAVAGASGARGAVSNAR